MIHPKVFYMFEFNLFFLTGQVKSKKLSAWGFMTTSLVSRISEKVRKIKESFVSPLDNYDPVKHIDFSQAYTQSLVR